MLNLIKVFFFQNNNYVYLNNWDAQNMSKTIFHNLLDVTKAFDTVLHTSVSGNKLSFPPFYCRHLMLF